MGPQETYRGEERRSEPPLSRAELRELFEQSADKIIVNTFGLLGVDIKNQDQRNALRDDFSWLRTLRVGAADAFRTARRAAITLIVGAILVWLGFKNIGAGG